MSEKLIISYRMGRNKIGKTGYYFGRVFFGLGIRKPKKGMYFSVVYYKPIDIENSNMKLDRT